MSDNTNIGLTVEAWAKIVIERWESKIKELGIHQGALLKSFTHHVLTQSNGDPEKIEFAFEYYGKFVDMGVGRGMPIGSREQIGSVFYVKRNDLGQLERHNRIKKPWYSPVFFGQVKELVRILAEKYAHNAQLAIVTNSENLTTGDLFSGSSKKRTIADSKSNPTARQYDKLHGN